MNKIEKIKAEIERLKNELIQEAEKGYKSEFDEGRISAFEDMTTFVDSLEEEPVSNDLEKAAGNYAFTMSGEDEVLKYYAFIAGAQWQKGNLWKDAQGDDLPEIDREVVVLAKSLPEHEDSLLKVSIAHRPPEYWEGKSIGTGKITRYEPKRYDKGGWNQPNVVYWLDVELPKEEE